MPCEQLPDLGAETPVRRSQTLGADHLLEYLGELSVHAGARIPTPQAVLRIIASKACRYLSSSPAPRPNPPSRPTPPLQR
jgi:hypothetical protein